jgi:hypothetical protein
VKSEVPDTVTANVHDGQRPMNQDPTGEVGLADRRFGATGGAIVAGRARRCALGDPLLGGTAVARDGTPVQ